MNEFFRPNIGAGGRIVRGLLGLAMLAAGWLLWDRAAWASVILFVCGIFTGLEALRGWCLARACGIKTRF